MKFDCGPDALTRLKRKHARLSEWHKWFAWFPTRIAEGDCRWLETIERKGTYTCYDMDFWWTWEYRA